MGPGLPKDDTRNVRIVDAKLTGYLPLGNTPGVQDADLSHLIFGEFALTIGFPPRGKLEARSDRVKGILPVGHPFEIFKAVICLVAIFVIAFRMKWVQSTEGGEDEAVDFEYPWLLQSGIEKNLGIPLRVEGRLENLPSIGTRAFLRPLNMPEA